MNNNFNKNQLDEDKFLNNYNNLINKIEINYDQKIQDEQEEENKFEDIFFKDCHDKDNLEINSIKNNINNPKLFTNQFIISKNQNNSSNICVENNRNIALNNLFDFESDQIFTKFSNLTLKSSNFSQKNHILEENKNKFESLNMYDIDIKKFKDRKIEMEKEKENEKRKFTEKCKIELFELDSEINNNLSKKDSEYLNKLKNIRIKNELNKKAIENNQNQIEADYLLKERIGKKNIYSVLFLSSESLYLPIYNKRLICRYI